MENTLATKERYLEELLVDLKTESTAQSVTMIERIQEGIRIARHTENVQAHFSLVNHWGTIYLRQALYHKALPLFEEALHLAKQLQAPHLLAPTLNNIGLVYKAQEQYAKALDCFFEGLSHNQLKWNAYLYSNIGVVLDVQKNRDKALYYYQKALQQAQQQTDKNMLLVSYANIGTIYQKEARIEEAISSYLAGLALCEGEAQYSLHQAIFNQNLGAAHAALEQIEKALHYYHQAEGIYEKEQFNFYWMRCQLEIGTLYLESAPDKAAFYFKKAQALCEKYQFEKDQLECLENLQTYYQSSQQRAQLIQVLQHLVQLQKSYFSKEKTAEISAIIQTKEHQIQHLIQQNEQIAEQNQQLEQSNKELEQYAFVIAHDLKEPLRNISSFIQLIQRKGVSCLDASMIDYLDIVDQNAQQINQKLEALLVYSTLTLQKDALQNIDMNTLVETLLASKSSAIQAAQASIHIDPLSNVIANPKHIQVLFSHLIQNALMYRNPERPLVLHISSVIQDDALVFCIKDNGFGIAKAYQEKIFQLFQRLDKKTQQGVGMGLALCEKIAALYEAKIWVESEEGSGSRFYVEWSADYTPKS